MSIAWKPIAEIPDELLDGRSVLLWQAGFGATIANWVVYAPGTEPAGASANWIDDNGTLGHITLTHFAAINAPDA